ncbi:hypothetical protein GGG16DRAFT_99261 [Schizophyllum commune]
MATTDMPPPPHFDPDLKYGPAFIGCIIAGIYYKGRFQDPKVMRVFVRATFPHEEGDLIDKPQVYALLLLETTHLVLTIHVCYFYMITNYNNSRSTENPTWSFLIQMIVEPATLYLLYASFGCSVVGDMLIAVSIRTGAIETDSIIDVLVLYAMATGLSTSLGEIVCFISYAVRKHDLIFVGVYFTLSTPSAMMVLNTLPPSAHSSADTHTLFDSSAKSGEAFSDGPSHGDGVSEEGYTRRPQGWLGWKGVQRA